MAVKLKPNVPLQYDKSMQFIYLTFLTFVLITLEPMIVEIDYGYHWNCIKMLISVDISIKNQG